MCTIIKVLRLQKDIKKYKNMLSTVVSCVDDNTLAKIVRKCEGYITYTIDNKQLNKKQEVNTRQKEFLELLEMCKAQIVFNSIELSTKEKPISESITSTFNEAESKPVKESKKKEKSK